MIGIRYGSADIVDELGLARAGDRVDQLVQDRHERAEPIGRLRGERRADQPAQPLVVVALGGQDRRPGVADEALVGDAS